jgi:oxygen-independent coproporphyrinogen III oxidase
MCGQRNPPLLTRINTGTRLELIHVRARHASRIDTGAMNTDITFDPDVLRRHDRPGPRYTSYPTAPQFAADFGEREFRMHALRSNDEPIPRSLSLYVHVPYCFSPCFYCGCNRIITRDLRRGPLYVERLTREIDNVSKLFDRDRDVVQLHLGGGTPNFLSCTAIGDLMDSIGRRFHLSGRPDRDFSIELDPRCVEGGDISVYAALGFTRASIGVQDFDPAVQQAVNRVQSVGQTLEVIDHCRRHGFRSVNVDLIHGLPKQTRAGFAVTLDTVLMARPERLSIYGYAHMPQMFKAQRQIESADLPDAATKLGLLELAIEKLTAAGYRHIGMDHFALPGDDLSVAQDAGELHRNFMGYTTHAACDLIGFGVSAISHIGDSFSQNPRELPVWETSVDGGRLPVWRGMTLSPDDRIRGDVIQALMCHGQVDVPDVENRHDIDFREYFAQALAGLVPLAADGLVTVDQDRIATTSRGRLLLRIIAMCFDRYLSEAQSADHRPRYSRVI